MDRAKLRLYYDTWQSFARHSSLVVQWFRDLSLLASQSLLTPSECPPLTLCTMRKGTRENHVYRGDGRTGDWRRRTVISDYRRREFKIRIFSLIREAREHVKWRYAFFLFFFVFWTLKEPLLLLVRACNLGVKHPLIYQGCIVSPRCRVHSRQLLDSKRFVICVWICNLNEIQIAYQSYSPFYPHYYLKSEPIWQWWAPRWRKI